MRSKRRFRPLWTFTTKFHLIGKVWSLFVLSTPPHKKSPKIFPTLCPHAILAPPSVHTDGRGLRNPGWRRAVSFAARSRIALSKACGGNTPAGVFAGQITGICTWSRTDNRRNRSLLVRASTGGVSFDAGPDKALMRWTELRPGAVRAQAGSAGGTAERDETARDCRKTSVIRMPALARKAGAPSLAGRGRLRQSTTSSSRACRPCPAIRFFRPG
ncbi:hypothetical protein IMCC20628_03828 [Hoeflea sp. IMCC20628]|nr:hypothetical protein IMCC20628_03828 [Hoeflea sp. IMCC20628]